MQPCSCALDNTKAVSWMESVVTALYKECADMPPVRSSFPTDMCAHRYEEHTALQETLGSKLADVINRGLHNDFHGCTIELRVQHVWRDGRPALVCRLQSANGDNPVCFEEITDTERFVAYPEWYTVPRGWARHACVAPQMTHVLAALRVALPWFEHGDQRRWQTLDEDPDVKHDDMSSPRDIVAEWIEDALLTVQYYLLERSALETHFEPDDVKSTKRLTLWRVNHAAPTIGPTHEETVLADQPAELFRTHLDRTLQTNGARDELGVTTYRWMMFTTRCVWSRDSTAVLNVPLRQLVARQALTCVRVFCWQEDAPTGS